MVRKRSKWHELHPVEHVRRVEHLGQQLLVVDESTIRAVPLRAKHYSGKRFPGRLATGSLGEKIGILSEHYVPQGRGSIQQVGIGKAVGPVLLSRQYVNSPKA
jgi:hypothetical protein